MSTTSITGLILSNVSTFMPISLQHTKTNSYQCLRNRARGLGLGCTRHEFAGPRAGSTRGCKRVSGAARMLSRTRFQGIACVTKLI